MRFPMGPPVLSPETAVSSSNSPRSSQGAGELSGLLRKAEALQKELDQAQAALKDHVVTGQDAASRVRLASMLRDESRATAGRSRQRLRGAFVVAEVAVAVVLLVGAGLLVRSFARLSAVDPGFDPDRVLVFPILLDGKEYGGGGRSGAYYRDLTAKLSALPGVEWDGDRIGGSTEALSYPEVPGHLVLIARVLALLSGVSHSLGSKVDLMRTLMPYALGQRGASGAGRSA